MKPPFIITNTILSLCSEIYRLIGKYEGIHAPAPKPELRRQNKIKSIHGSLAIEGNTLDLDQVTAILDDRRVIGDPREILEVRNAIKAYEQAPKWSPARAADLLKAHAVMMSGLVRDAGKYRTSNVGVIKGSKVGHVAPKPRLVPSLMDGLFKFLRHNHDVPVLIKACVFHYELEFIHPFSDGNGRMGRLWQHVILHSHSPLFAFAPVESMMKARQQGYYQALSESDKAGESTEFVEFCLTAIRDSLFEIEVQIRGRPATTEDRLNQAQENFRSKTFARKDYMVLFKTISTATASRDLLTGVQQGRLEKLGEKASTKYLFQSVANIERS